MKHLFQSVKINDSTSKFHGKTVDILVSDGKIERIDKKLDAKKAEIVDCKGCTLSNGWVDLHVNFKDPGFETAETLESGALAAAAGGFTAVAMMPTTMPIVDSKSGIEYIKKNQVSLPVNILPIGSLSVKREGVDLAELFDMSKAGAVAFSDADRPITDSGLMLRALYYAKIFDGLVISNANDPCIAANGLIHEGVVGAALGMRTLPALAEELMISRDISLTAYSDGKIHFTNITTAGAVNQIRKAKKDGLNVTCDVAAHHLVLSDENVMSFDSNYKVFPPLRSDDHIKALWEGLKDGTIDAISSQHTPLEQEFKAVEFEIAKAGIIGVQTLYGMLKTLASEKFTDELIDKVLVNGPRKILGLAPVSVEQGAPADFTIYGNQDWEFNSITNLSTSKNTPLFGEKLTGNILGTYTKGMFNRNLQSQTI
ncbi:MAG: dihydroorotase [Sphingobacteriales bacterium]|jgi:dihydroorotase